MTERPSPCTDCKDKPCESPYNEGECWKPNTLAQLITLGGEKVAELVEKLSERK